MPLFLSFLLFSFLKKRLKRKERGWQPSWAQSSPIPLGSFLPRKVREHEEQVNSCGSPASTSPTCSPLPPLFISPSKPNPSPSFPSSPAAAAPSLLPPWIPFVPCTFLYPKTPFSGRKLGVMVRVLCSSREAVLRGNGN